MAVHNAEIADLFDRLATLLEIEDANPFRIRAYRNAARLIRGHPEEMAALLAAGRDLARLPGIGDDLAQKIATIVETGSLPLLDEVEQKAPRTLAELTRIDGLGPRRVRQLHQELGIRSIDDLARAIEAGRVRELEGFGAKTEDAIRAGIAQLRGGGERMLLAQAEPVAEALVDYLRAVEGVKEVTPAGSYRRRRETVGDLDILVTCSKGSPVMERFVHHDEVERVVSHGETRSTVHLRSGLQVDLRVVPQVSYGAALHYFTGSKEHNIAVRRRAGQRGLKINEYGVYRGDRRVAGRTEQEIFEQVGLPFIPPELRENRGEIEAAETGTLPTLVREQDLRGDLHCHTDATDGQASLRAMAEAARARGYEYLAITDHSRAVRIAHGLTARRLRQQIDAIDRLNEQLDGITLLRGIEVDILEDGTLDLPDSVLARLDLIVGSIHSRFHLSARKQTERVLRAMDNPHFHILGHPSSRLLNRRGPLELDLARIIEGAAERGCFLELNAQPARLDLTDSGCLLAREHGVKVALSTDAHSTAQLGYMHFGIGQARRGWLEPDDVINTRNLADLRRLLRR